MRCGGVVLLLVVFSSSVYCALNNLGQKPYQGWSSWSLSAIQNAPAYGEYWLNETNIQIQSDAMAKLLQSSGYTYINIDAFWATNNGAVDTYGRWTTNLTRFPSGFNGIANYVHKNNQKIGIYFNPGVAKSAVTLNTPILNTTCHAQDIAMMPLQSGNVFGDTYAINYSNPCAQAYMDSVAEQLAEWGVDFVKLDAVSPGSDSNLPDTRPDVEAWAKALAKTGRDIWFTISWHINSTYAPFWKQYANAWRVEDDVECYCNTLTAWYSVVRRFTDVQVWLPFAGPGGWNDLDSVDVGNGTISGLTDDERRSYFTFWAVSAAPLYTGNDLTQMDELGLELLTNPAVLAINQLGIPAWPTNSTASSELQVWYIHSESTNSTIVALFNLTPAQSAIAFTWEDIGLPITNTYLVTDVWAGEVMGKYEGKLAITVNTHATVLLSLS